MECENEHYRHILLFYFLKGKNAASAYEKIVYVYGKEAISERTCQNWFKRFCSKDFALKNKQRPGRLIQVNDEELRAIVGLDPIASVRGIGGFT